MAKKELELTRKEYEKIKRMDHHTMKCYLDNIYQTGYADGGKAPSEDQLRDGVGKIKGIGKKKVQAVVDAIIEIWEQEGSRC